MFLNFPGPFSLTDLFAVVHSSPKEHGKSTYLRTRLQVQVLLRHYRQERFMIVTVTVIVIVIVAFSVAT